MSFDDRLRNAYRHELDRAHRDVAPAPKFVPPAARRGPAVVAIAALFLGVLGLLSLMDSDTGVDPTVRLETTTNVPAAADPAGPDGAGGDQATAPDAGFVAATDVTATPTSTAEPVRTPANGTATESTGIPAPTEAPTGSDETASPGSIQQDPEPETEPTPAIPDPAAAPSPTPSTDPDPFDETPNAAATPTPGPDPTAAVTAAPTASVVSDPTATPEEAATPLPTPSPTATQIPTATPEPTPTATAEPTATATPTSTPETQDPGAATSECPSGSRARLEQASLRYITEATGWGRLADLVDEQDGPYYFMAWEPGFVDKVTVEVTLAEPALASDIRVFQDPFTPVSGSIDIAVNGQDVQIALSGTDGWRIHPFPSPIRIDRFEITRDGFEENIMEVMICLAPMQ